MKLLKYIFSLCVIAGLLTSCSNDDFATLDGTAQAPTITSSGGQNFVLTIDSVDAPATTLSWSALQLNVSTPVSYILEMATGGTNFAEPKIIQNSAETSYAMTIGQLNAQAIAQGILPDSTGTLDFRVTARIGNGNATDFVSQPITLTVTPYADFVDISSTWGVVGSATINGWNGPDVPMYKTDEDGVFVAYTTLIDGEIKFRENNAWDHNFGGANGQLIDNGANIVVTAGKYKIILNLNDQTYSLEPFSLGIVGSATPNGWSGPDIEMQFDPSTNTFRKITSLADGEIKFRLNNDFGTNWGGTGGTLVPGGANIAVAAGKYVVTVDLNKLTYKLEPLAHIWGLVGSATPNGWNGPDIQLKLDYTSNYASGVGIWYLNNVQLNAGELKFRADNAWDVNYGDAGADGTLDSGGDNIVISTAGSYDILFDLSSLTYTITPHQ